MARGKQKQEHSELDLSGQGSAQKLYRIYMLLSGLQKLPMAKKG
jgi:hypothetical protein